MNRSLATLAQSLGANQMTEAANLIGHGVLVPGNDVSPESGHNGLGFELALPADAVTVSIADAAGRPVRTIEVGAAQSGVTLLAWDGLTDAGQAAAPGRYRFTVNAVQGGQKVDTTALALGVVDSVSHGAQGVALGLGEDRSAGLGDVRQVF
jgi:flagellar basal-body rod modification protein FlgD